MKKYQEQGLTIGELHKQAQKEFRHDPEALARLNDTYETQRAAFVGVVLGEVHARAINSPMFLAAVSAGVALECRDYWERIFTGLCPFHEEKTPSFMIDVKTNQFHCFGCGASGNVADFSSRRTPTSVASRLADAVPDRKATCNEDTDGTVGRSPEAP